MTSYFCNCGNKLEFPEETQEATCPQCGRTVSLASCNDGVVERVGGLCVHFDTPGDHTVKPHRPPDADAVAEAKANCPPKKDDLAGILIEFHGQPK